MTRHTSVNPLGERDRESGEETSYAELIRAIQAGDEKAMERLLMRTQEVAYRFSQHVCGRADDADDAMQEALLKIYRYAARIREPAAFRTWLYRTVKNACLIGRRRHAGEPLRVLSLDEPQATTEGTRRPMEAVDPAKGPHELASNRALRRRLLRALRALPPAYRLIVFLREMEGLSTREVAAVTGISEANVKTRLHRARLFLRKELDKP